MIVKLLGRDEILVAEDMSFEDVEVEAWGGTVRVKALTGAERDRFEASLSVQKGRKIKMDISNVRARLLVICLVDDKEKPLFKRNDIEALGRKSAAALDEVFDVAKRLAGMSEKDIEEMTEDFFDDQKNDSTSS